MGVIDIVRLGPPDAASAMADLVDLLVDSVEGGASVGFLGPLDRETAEAYWAERLAEAGQDKRLITVYVPQRFGKLAKGNTLWLVTHPSNPQRALPASVFL